MENRRIGSFEIPTYIIQYHPDVAMDIMRDMIIVRAEQMFHVDGIEYIGICDVFQENPGGMIVPTYEVIINKTSLKDDEGRVDTICNFEGFNDLS